MVVIMGLVTRALACAKMWGFFFLSFFKNHNKVFFKGNCNLHVQNSPFEMKQFKEGYFRKPLSNFLIRSVAKSNFLKLRKFIKWFSLDSTMIQFMFLNHFLPFSYIFGKWNGKSLIDSAHEHNDKTRESAVCESSIENLRTLMLWFGPKHDDRIYLVE